VERNRVEVDLPIGDHENPFGSPDRFVRYEYRMAVDCILPKLSEWGVKIGKQKILDVGCGAGGLTLAMAENSADCVGIDLNPAHIAEAARLASERSVIAEFAAADILKVGELDRILSGRSFQLVILSEVLEHLLTRENVSSLLLQLKKYLASDGRLYVSFPPWFNPFGGHQAGWPRIHWIPWFHLLPVWLKRSLAPEQVDQYLTFFAELNRLTIASFERSARRAGLQIVNRDLFHLRPEYYWRYGVPPLRSPLIGRIPGVRELTTTGAFYLLKAE
jgi:SAM-dependent methyltransferase